VLIGNWDTTGTHLLIPDVILHGRTSFEWLENGAFLLMRSEIDDPRFPTGIAILPVTMLKERITCSPSMSVVFPESMT
jgi:hypothetical protein